MERTRCLGCMKIKTAPVCEHCGFDETMKNAPHQLPIGSVLKEQYRIGRVLGQGGFGITYLGWDMYLDMPVAIKEYYPSGTVMREAAVTMEVADVTGDDGARFRNNRDRFMREAKMLARFAQVPEIVQIKNFFLANNTAYIVMEYVEGITLKQHVKNSGGKISVEETFRLLGPVIETLSKVHKTGIVHRDISPDNIMMLPGGGCKLLDFGAVRDVKGAEAGKELTKSTEAILKQGYAPIEQYQKKGSLGPWTDVYALCATIYYCLTGEVPPDSPARVLAYEEMDMEATRLNEAQKMALLHGMALRVEDRTRSMEELHQELFGEKPAPEVPVQPVTQVKPVEEPAKPEPKPEPGPKPKGKLIAAIAAVAVVIAVVLGLTMGSGGRGSGNSDETVPETVTIEEVASGTCETLNWVLNSQGELRITGDGAIPNDNAPWSACADQIRCIVLEGNITRIGSGAFADCALLQQVDFGTALEEIGSGAFRNAGFAYLPLPDTLKTIHDSAFEGSHLTEVVIPDSVEFIGNWAFARCDGLASVTIGPNTRLCYDELNNTASLPIFCNAEGTFDGSLVLKGYAGGIVEDYANIVGCPFEAIGEAEAEGLGTIEGDVTWWFDRETGFLKISGSGNTGHPYSGSYQYEKPWERQNAKEVPWAAFREEIRTVSIGDGITNIEPNTFEKHSNLDDVYFGNDVTYVGPYAFADTKVDWLHFPDNIRVLEPYAFHNCDSLRYVALPLWMERFRTGIFNSCENIEVFFPGNYYFDFWDRNENENIFCDRATGKKGMPQNMTIYTCGLYTGHDDFAEHYGYELATGVDGRVFDLGGDCGENTYWFLEDGVLTIFGLGNTGFFNTNATDARAWGGNEHQNWNWEEASFHPYREEIEHIVIEPGVTRLGRNLFADMPNLKSIDFGTVEAVFTQTIVNCGIEELVFPDTIHTILNNAVVNCPQLRTVEIHNGTATVGTGVFDGCTALEDVYFYADAKPDRFFLRGTENVTVHAYENSPAIAYAQAGDIPYEIIK